VGELEVIASILDAEHDAVESFVVLKAPNDAKAEATTVHVSGSCKIADGSGDSKMKRHRGSRGRGHSTSSGRSGLLLCEVECGVGEKGVGPPRAAK
jgi:hypothetical protein